MDANDKAVYFAHAPVADLIKIGCARYVPGRVSALSKQCGEKLTVLATCDGGYALEQSLLARFAEHRDHGEWFRPAPEILAVVADIRAGKGPTTKCPTALGDAIVAFRIRHGMSQGQFAIRMGTSQQCVCRWEDGTTAMMASTTLFKLSRVLGIPYPAALDMAIAAREAQQARKAATQEGRA